MLQVVRAFEEASGRAVALKTAGRRAGDVAACYSDCSLAAGQLGWRAKRGLHDMCKYLIDAYAARSLPRERDAVAPRSRAARFARRERRETNRITNALVTIGRPFAPTANTTHEAVSLSKRPNQSVTS